MATQQILEGDWNQIKGNLRRKWGELTDDDLSQTRGDMEELIGLIRRKTGEGREAIEHYLDELSGSAASAVGTTARRFRGYAQQAAGNVRQTAEDAAGRVRAGYDEATRFVGDRPAQSMALCFGIGLLTGVFIGMSMRSR